MKKYPVAAFYLLAILISWAGWGPVVLGSRGVSFFQSPFFQILLILPAVGPMVAAVIVLRRAGEGESVRAMFRSLFGWRVSARWVGVAVGLPLLLLLIGRGATAWLGLAAKPVLAQGNPVATFLMALVIALVANPWEEVGWRGFALPRLQTRYNAFFASLLVGGMWAVWHLPLFFWPDNPMSETPFWRFALGTLASACLYTWLYNSANGSLFIVALHHVAWNTFGAVIGGVSGLAVTIVQWGMVLGLLAWFGAANLASRPRVVAGAHSYRANSS